MITDLWIENFKGIGKRQHIPLRPITLLFGANSAGKSTVMHALSYLREIVANRNCDAHKQIGGDQTISLGGFANLLHRSLDQSSNSISLGVKFVVSEEQQERFNTSLEMRFKDLLSVDSFDSGEIEWMKEHMPRPPRNVKVDILVSRPNAERAPTVSGFQITTDGGAFLSLRLSQNGLAEGWVNLMSSCWGCPAVDEELLRRISQSYFPEGKEKALFRERYQAFYVTACETLRRTLLDKCSVHADQRETTSSSQFVSRIIECPEFEPLRISILELLDDADFWADQEIYAMPLVLYLEKICQDPDQLEIDVLSAMHEKDGVYVLISNKSAQRFETVEPYSIPRSLNIVMSPRPAGLREDEPFDKLDFGAWLPPVGLIADNYSDLMIRDVVGVIRHYWTLRVALGVDAEGAQFQGRWTHQFKTSLRHSAMPLLNQPFMPEAAGTIVPSVQHEDEGPLDASDRIPELVDETVNAIISASMSWLESELTATTYIGPKRSAVPRHLSDRTVAEFSEWGSGLAAWRWLIEADINAFQECSNWLARLGDSQGDRAVLGYQLLREKFVEVTVESLDRLRNVRAMLEVNDLQSHTRLFLLDRESMQKLHPQDVGEGITQVVPVITALVRASHNTAKHNGSLVAIEQPELHLHPSLAAKLGDLIIATLVGLRGSQCLIETHSEHLILRILRRIRQTTDNELPDTGKVLRVNPDDVCVVWVDKVGGDTVVKRLRIDDRGEFIDRWPQGFFRERAEELY